MKAYALGIVAVLFLSIGYSAFITAEVSRETTLASARQSQVLTEDPTYPFEDVATSAGARKIDEPEAVVLPSRKTHRRVSRDVQSSRRLNTLPSRLVATAHRRIFRDTQSALSKVRPENHTAMHFNETVIFYREPNRALLADTPDKPLTASIREPRRKNKSILSKTFSVVKKPYDWLKTVAKKFD